ncbi:MAG TPA: DUF882 domain-containing protein [Steroidobacteraceae bacterium]|nr:DUF882 domain-containing protein [Steroidobacteraceae bacterium]
MRHYFLPAAPAVPRRRFLRQAGAVALAFLPAPSLWARTSPTRSLAFIHTHTGERLSSVYYRDGVYVPAELERINRVLRDFRTGDVRAIEPGVLDILNELQALADRDEPFEVICGYRSPQTNAMLRELSHGVAEHSLHLEGRAIDVRLPGVATAALRDLALGMGRGGVGYYHACDFVHLDNGRVRHW